MPVQKTLDPEQMKNEANLEWSIKFAINCLEQTAADLDLRISVPTVQQTSLQSMMGLKYRAYNKIQTLIDQKEAQKQQTMEQVQAIVIHKQQKEQEMWEDYGRFLKG